MDHLRLVALGDYIDVITDYHSNGSYESLKKHVTLLDEKSYAIIIRTLNFERQDFKKDLLYVDEDAYKFLSKSEVYPDDILMNKIANPGSLYIMPDLHCPVTCGMNLFLLRFNDEINQRYMYYNMKNVEDYIKSYSHGTTTKTITKDDVRGIKVYIHNRADQEVIADFLTTLDNAIENNRKIINTLEKTICLLYRYWFVQFDFPDDNGKPYKTNGGKFYYNASLKKDIPDGWERLSLGKELIFERGIEVGSDNYYEEKKEGLVSYIRVSDLNSQSSLYTDKGLLENKILRPEDVCVSLDGTVGKVDYGLFGGFSSGIRRVYDPVGRFNNATIYAFLMSDFIQYVIRSFATGSNILHASEAINHMDIAYNESVMRQFQEHITPMFKKMLEMKLQNDKLIQKRALFLPMLMNGQITLGA